MVNIVERSAEVEDRVVPGSWEGDLITGAENKSVIGTLVEHATGYVLLLHLPEAHGVVEVEQEMVRVMSQLPATLRRTLTWDQGQEMRNHARIAAATDLGVYFCDLQLTLATREQREREWVTAPVLSQEHGPRWIPP